MPTIKIKTIIDAPIERCFDLACSIDLHKISTAKTKESVVGGRTEGLIKMNETVTWRAKHFGVWQKLTSKIISYDRPRSFCDEMQKGTFKSFKHEHYFEEKNKQTTITDICHFESPLGILGHLFNRLVLTNYMTKFLEERNSIIKEFAESVKWKAILNHSNPK